MALLELKDVSFSYDKRVKAVKNVSFEVEKGEYIAIIGHNGSGKSTLAKLFNGLLLPTKGELTVSGFSTADKKSLYEIRKRVGVVFQNPDNQLVSSIVEDDVAFGPENLGLPREEIGSRIDFALKAVGMEKFRRSTPERLSGGQKQRIAIAGVLALRPEVLVLDEATSMLDPEGRAEILEIVERLNREQGVTVITITHYMDEVIRADRVLVINDGEIALSGSPKEIFAHGSELKAFGLELPLALYIAQRLREEGVPVKDGILTKEELAEELCRLSAKI